MELQIKYEGYIKIQLEQVEAMRKLESKSSPADLDYNTVPSLRLEAIEKLNKIKPLSVGQASRISGVNPADVGVLLVWLEQKNRQKSLPESLPHANCRRPYRKEAFNDNRNRDGL